jgi:hypothetical protein
VTTPWAEAHESCEQVGPSTGPEQIAHAKVRKQRGSVLPGLRALRDEDEEAIRLQQHANARLRQQRWLEYLSG